MIGEENPLGWIFDAPSGPSLSERRTIAQIVPDHSRIADCRVACPAFTLLELLMVIGIALLLLAIVLPSLSAARQQGKRATCLSHQRQIVLAMHAYTCDYQDRFPIAQYFDEAHGLVVAWDTITQPGWQARSEPGLIWQSSGGEGVQQCPSFEGASMTAADRFTGYNYNTTYIGRGEGEGRHRGQGMAPATLSEVRYATQAVLIGDGGWKSGANKFMRAPLDEGASEGSIHAGAQAFRHRQLSNGVYIDGHGQSAPHRFRKPGATPASERLLGWPSNAFLSPDDKSYAHR